MALNKTYWDYDNAQSGDWAVYGLKYANKQIYANPNFSWGNLDYSFPTSFRKRNITRLKFTGNGQAQACETIPDCVIYNSMISYTGNAATGSFYKDNYWSYYNAGNEGYFPVIDIDTHDFAYKMTLALFSGGNWITVNAVDFINNYDNYAANVYGYINNFIETTGGRRYAFCNYYVTQDSQFSVHANMYGYRTSGYGSTHLGGHAVSGQTAWSNRSIWQLCATTAGNYSNLSYPANSYFPYEIPELSGQSWNAGNQTAPAAIITGGIYTNHAVLTYSDQRVYMPLKHILKDIIVNSGLVLLDSNNDKWISMVDSNGLCQDKLVLMSSDEAKESSIYNTRTSDNNLNPAPAPPGPSGDNIDDMNMNALWAMSSDAGFARYFLLSHDQLASLMTWLSDTTFPDGYDPYAYILSLLQFPLKLTPLWCMPRTPAGHIVIGGEDTGITASLIANEKAWVGAGTYDVPQLNGNFLDYDPYTQYELYIPCCGWVSLPDIVCGRKIAVKINYDLTTAAIIGNVYVTIDGKEMIVASKSGMMGRETIVTGEAQGVRSAQITSALLNAGTGALNVATGAMSGNAVAAVSGGYNIVAGLAQANIAANSAYTRTIGSTGGRALLCQFDQCYLKICTTRADIPANYGHTCGYVCNLKGKVSDFTAYTVFDNVDVSGIGKATDREKKLIKQILESGVIINPTE